MDVSTTQLLPPQMLPAVPHIAFSIFNFAIPNIFAWLAVFGLVLLAGWARLPKIFEPNIEPGEDHHDESDPQSTTLFAE
jgi:hypothetical protein